MTIWVSFTVPSISWNSFQRRPAVESVPVSYGMLCVGQAPARAPVSSHAQDVFRLLLQMIEIRKGWQALRHRLPFLARRPPTGHKGRCSDRPTRNPPPVTTAEWGGSCRQPGTRRSPTRRGHASRAQQPLAQPDGGTMEFAMWGWRSIARASVSFAVSAAPFPRCLT